MSNTANHFLEASDSACLQRIGKQILSLRKERNWTQQELAEATHKNISPAMISRYENGQADMQLSTCLAITQALGVTPNDVTAWMPDNAESVDEPTDYILLSGENRKIVEKIIHALVVEQKTLKK